MDPTAPGRARLSRRRSLSPRPRTASTISWPRTSTTRTVTMTMFEAQRQASSRPMQARDPIHPSLTRLLMQCSRSTKRPRKPMPRRPTLPRGRPRHAKRATASRWRCPSLTYAPARLVGRGVRQTTRFPDSTTSPSAPRRGADQARGLCRTTFAARLPTTTTRCLPALAPLRSARLPPATAPCTRLPRRWPERAPTTGASIPPRCAWTGVWSCRRPRRPETKWSPARLSSARSAAHPAA